MVIPEKMTKRHVLEIQATHFAEQRHESLGPLCREFDRDGSAPTCHLTWNFRKATNKDRRVRCNFAHTTFTIVIRKLYFVKFAHQVRFRHDRLSFDKNDIATLRHRRCSRIVYPNRLKVDGQPTTRSPQAPASIVVSPVPMCFAMIV